MADDVDDRAFYKLAHELSAHAFRVHAGAWTRDEWGKNRPPSAHWLPIDDTIDQLVARNMPPRIDLMQPASRPLADDGPYRLARAHFFLALWDMHRNPDFEEERHIFLKNFVGKLMAAEKALKEVSDIFWAQPSKIAREGLHKERMSSLDQLNISDPPDKFSESLRQLPESQLWKALIGYGEDIERGRDALFELAEIAVSEAAVTRVVKNLGPQQVLWKRDFVSRMANLWRLLTGEKASRAEDSLFGAFVYAAWASLGPNMPEVSFARAIRDNSPST